MFVFHVGHDRLEIVTIANHVSLHRKSSVVAVQNVHERQNASDVVDVVIVENDAADVVVSVVQSGTVICVRYVENLSEFHLVIFLEIFQRM